MTDDSFSLYQVVNQDPRYPVEAYWFVREALAYAADTMELSCQAFAEPDNDSDSESDSSTHQVQRERHLTGQQLCEAIRRYALNQYGYMSKVVLNNWNLDATTCFGDIVYNMIDVGIMKKSSEDKRSHFDDVFRFDDVFETDFQICDAMAQRRS